MNKKTPQQCEFCSYYEFNDESGLYECQINLDEDEMYRLALGGGGGCTYFYLNDDYKIVRKQN